MKIKGTPFSDWIVGGDKGEKFFGTDAIDHIASMGGNDYIDAGAGKDIVYGGYGDDRIYGGADNDLLVGEAGQDDIHGGSGNDGAYGGGGHDQMYGDKGNDVLFGDGGNDSLEGDTGDDVLRGGTGDDRLIGGEGNDKLIGGAGVDKMVGGEGHDTFVWTLADAFLDGEKPLNTMDYVIDFGKEDVLDLSGMFAKMDIGEALQHIKLEDTGEGTVIVVDAGNGGDWSKVAMLIDFHMTEPKELWANDMLII